MKISYRRRLPHLQPPEATFFLTYQLAGALPRQVLSKIQEEYEQKKFDLMDRFYGDQPTCITKLEHLQNEFAAKKDRYLDQVLYGPTWLLESEIAAVVQDSLHFLERQLRFWKLWAFTIMPNHVHLVCTLEPNAPPLHEVMRRHKGYTARQCNRLLGREGKFWQEETFDRLIRGWDDFHQKVYYVLDNPVKARLVDQWVKWSYIYCHSALYQEFC